ncbi:cytochrome-c peroxidase [Rhizobium mayense]|uniref:Cytochrome c peroxidase n=1 Tax=Rhizobium mayense TaxID=1312184 RepID=A0ABT7JSY3_9HYPH|nr:cytochrome c peroxidase [Rhizobium mayense]MDL2399451.1 cytochrome c peroxidase [Rhizobium mayense]
MTLDASSEVITPEDQEVSFSNSEEAIILGMSPMPEPPSDPTNRLAQAAGAIALGRRLFFDSRLSQGNVVSCASCHNPLEGWADGRPLAQGLALGDRNTPSLANSSYQRWFGWTGASATLWQQIIRAITNPHEMGGTPVAVAELLETDTIYSATFKDVLADAYGRSIDHSVGSLNEPKTKLVAAAKAIAAFVATLSYGCAPFDRFVDGLRTSSAGEQEAISSSAKRGLKIFIGKGRCNTCHYGPLFSDREFHDLKVPGRDGKFSDDTGRYLGLEQLAADGFGPNSDFSDSKDSEIGNLINYTKKLPENVGQFRTPSLRNVSLTAPYMHAGQYTSLLAVLDHYSEMADAMVLNHSDEGVLVPLFLTISEKNDLISFLETLTDYRLESGANLACEIRK